MKYSRPIAAAVLTIGCSALALGVPAAPTPPKEIVLGVGADESQRTVTWFSSMRSGEVHITGPDGARVVRAETQGTQVGLHAHTATFEVEPGNTYTYQVGAGSNFSEPVEFQAHSPGDEFTFAFFGDPQIGVRKVEEDAEGWRQATAEVRDVDFAISGGDQIQQGIRPHYAGFFDNPDLTTTAWAMAIGNHDNRNRAPFVQHFGRADHHWSFDYGDLRVFMLDGNQPDTIADWLAKQEPGRWTIAVIHQPPYTQGKLNSIAQQIRDELTGPFADAGIDLVLSGHNHSYTRSHPIDGVTYVAANSSTGSKFYDLEGPAKDTTAVWNQDFTPDYTIVTVGPDELKVSTRDVGTKKVVDEFVINHRK